MLDVRRGREPSRVADHRIPVVLVPCGIGKVRHPEAVEGRERHAASVGIPAGVVNPAFAAFSSASVCSAAAPRSITRRGEYGMTGALAMRERNTAATRLSMRAPA